MKEKKEKTRKIVEKCKREKRFWKKKREKELKIYEREKRFWKNKREKELKMCKRKKKFEMFEKNEENKKKMWREVTLIYTFFVSLILYISW